MSSRSTPEEATDGSSNGQDHEQDDENIVSPFEAQYSDCSRVAPNERIKLIMACTMGGVIDGFLLDSLKEEPWNTQNLHLLKPTKAVLAKELKRRDSRISPSRLNFFEHIVKLEETNSLLSAKCTDFIKEKYAEALGNLNAELNKQKEKETRVFITQNDRLRFVECMVQDDVRIVYARSQDMMTRAELDSRNSEERDPTFFEALSSKFNDCDFEPVSKAYPGLHSDFATSFVLPKREYSLNPEKAKETLGLIKAALFKVIVKYEISGQGAMRRIDACNDWGSFDIGLCDGRDDRGNFLTGNTQYLLYWWDRLNEFQLLEFTCGNIPDKFTADSNNAPDITSPVSSRSSSAGLTKELARGVGMMGRSLRNFVDVEANEQIERLEEKKMEYELLLCDEISARKQDVLTKRISDITDKIKGLSQKRRKIEEEEAAGNDSH